MRCLSCYSAEFNPYDAGKTIGSTLKSISPEVIILFSSIHYFDFIDFFDGLYESLATEQCIVFGGTGDGYYTNQYVGNLGMSALGINSEGAITWTVEYEEGLDVDSYKTARRCAHRLLSNAGSMPLTALVISDGFAGDGVSINDGIRSVLPIPYAGGTTGDDGAMEKCFLLVNGKALRNAVGILAMSGSFSFAVHANSGWNPIGKIAKVTETRKNRVVRIGDMTAIEFFKKQIGFLPSADQLIFFPLAVYGDDGRFYLRAGSKAHEDSGEISLFGRIAPNNLIQITHAKVDDVLNGAGEVLSSFGTPAFPVRGIILFSCCARKWLLGTKVDVERQLCEDTFGSRVPFIGMPTFGEISPFRKADGTYSSPYFHNETLVVFLLGD